MQLQSSSATQKTTSLTLKNKTDLVQEEYEVPQRDEPQRLDSNYNT